VPEGAGLVVLFGSGETSASGRQVFDWLFHQLPAPIRVAILETPAGFELNTAQVAGRICDFLCHHLQNHDLQITVVPARKRGTPYSPDEPDIVAPILGSDVIFLGPGSPTYAVRQLVGSLAWQTLLACHRSGAAIVLASAAAIAAGARALPVYEIYKVGEDVHWRHGLDLFGAYGLRLVFVPHWNNNDGGADLDTSHCYMGQARWGPLLDLLPPDLTVVGIDEATALVIDLAASTCTVLGSGGVSVLGDGTDQRFQSGATYPLDLLGSLHQPEPEAGLPREVWEQVRDAYTQLQTDPAPLPPPEIIALLEQRETARVGQDWATADALREQIRKAGWQVADTPRGPQLAPGRQGTR
jgi:hypothetical protein